MIFFGVIILVFAVAGLTIAYNANYPGAVVGSQASIMGHTGDEIDGGVGDVGSGGSLGQPVWDSGWIDFSSTTTHTYNFPEITGATADDLFVDLQIMSDGTWSSVPAGISNALTSFDGTLNGLVYSDLTTSSIKIRQGSGVGFITKYRVRIWNTLGGGSSLSSYTNTCTTDGCTVSCDVGDIRTGCGLDGNGGAHNNNLDDAYPSSGESCTCPIYGSSGTCYAICLDIS